MAQVSISVADIQIGLEDEDVSAKRLSRLALNVIGSLVDELGARPAEEKEESDG